jgi:MSHA biogenesis protein MshL
LGQGFGAVNSLAPLTNVFSIAKNSGSFSTVVNLLSTQGNVQVLSSPRISTLNNQKAVIKVGQDQYFITGVSNTTNGLGSTSQSTQQVQIAPFFSGIALGVTPQISKNNNVILHLHPIISTVSQQQISYVLGGSGTEQNLPSALTQVRESDSIVRAESGQVVVIGGLMQSTTQESIAETPFFGEIPFVGAIFRSTKQVSTKSELVILLKPIIIESGTWNKEIEKSIEQYKDLDRSFHFGGKPETFGTEGEKKFGASAEKK